MLCTQSDTTAHFFSVAKVLQGKTCRFSKRTLIPCTPPERAPLLSILGDTFSPNVPFRPRVSSLSKADTPVRSNAVEKRERGRSVNVRAECESRAARPSA